MKRIHTKKAGVDRSHDRSIIEKTVFMLGHLGVVLIGVWLVLFNGATELGSLFGQSWSFSDVGRAYILLACAFLYWLRHCITLFSLLVRKVDWPEVVGLLVFIGLIEIGFLLIGGGMFRSYARGFWGLDFVALFLLLLGSYLNSWSEMQRKWWKRDPVNKGHCYTGGLFQYSMHINYFGDTVMFTGWCLLTGNLWTLLLPLLMAGMFVFYHIPALDAYLLEKYGEEFEKYSRKTKRFVPFVY